MGEPVWVLDSSSIIDIKTVVDVTFQWTVGERLKELAVAGRIAIPKQVIKEVSEVPKPDMPGAWAKNVESVLVHPLEVDFDVMDAILDDPALDGLVPSDSMNVDHADAYVVGLAVQVDRSYDFDATVVTKDMTDQRDAVGVVRALSIVQRARISRSRTAGCRRCWRRRASFRAVRAAQRHRRRGAEQGRRSPLERASTRSASTSSRRSPILVLGSTSS